MASSLFQLGNASHGARSRRPRAGSGGVEADDIGSIGTVKGKLVAGAVQTVQISHAGHLATGGGMSAGGLAQPASIAVPANAMEMRKCERSEQTREISVCLMVPRV